MMWPRSGCTTMADPFSRGGLMKSLALTAIVLVVAATIQDAWANCKTVRHPDGSYSTECPSEAPPPPAQVPVQPQISMQACQTPQGACTVRVSGYSGHPQPCTCRTSSGQVV